MAVRRTPRAREEDGGKFRHLVKSIGGKSREVTSIFGFKYDEMRFFS